MHGDCYFDPIDFVEYLVLIVAGFVGYAFGKYIAKKIENFKKEDITLQTLSDYNSLLEQALKTNYISDKELATLKEWNTNPSQWNAI